MYAQRLRKVGIPRNASLKCLLLEKVLGEKKRKSE